MNDVCSKKEDLEESDVGGPGVCRDLAQGIVVEEFPDILLHRGSGLVEQIRPPRADFEVGDKDVVDVLFVLEARKRCQEPFLSC